jgi:hypothetical protein
MADISCCGLVYRRRLLSNLAMVDNVAITTETTEERDQFQFAFAELGSP